MAIEKLNPEGLPPAQGYVHVVCATGQKTVYVAGQGAFDEHGALVGPGDHRAQAAQAFRNLEIALRAAGASFDDVVKCNMYVVGLTNETFAAFLEGLRDVGKHTPVTAATLVGVERLAYEGMLVEIEAVAVI